MKGQVFLFSLVLVVLLVEAKKEDGFCDIMLGFVGFTKSNHVCYGYKTLPRNIARPENIQILNLSNKNNTIQKISDGELERARLTNLIELHLDNCFINQIEEGAFRGGNKITSLWLENNQIQDLNLNVFSDLPKLESLRLSGNPLKRFEANEEFPVLNLKHLHLDNCGISYFPLNLLKNLQKLTTLYLKDNLLTTLNWKVFQPLENLSAVYLHGNPWICDCHVKFLLDYFDRKNVTIKRLWAFNQYPNCTSSSSRNNKGDLVRVSWNRINRKYLVCPPEVNKVIVIKFADSDDYHASFSKNKGDDFQENSDYSVAVHCSFTGYPKPEVEWLKDNIALDDLDDDDDDETKVFGNDGDASVEDTDLDWRFTNQLVIQNPKAEDAGNYECFVSNIAGNSAKSTLLSLPDMPHTTTTISPSITEKFKRGDGRSRPPKESYSTVFYLGLAIGALIVIVIVLVLVIVAIVYFVRYRKKQRLPKHIYRQTLPQEDRKRVSEVKSMEPPYPPLIPHENVYDYIYTRVETGEDGYLVPNRPPPLPDRPISKEENI